MSEISNKMKILLSVAIILIFSAVFHIYADSVWEGSAAMGRYGEFPFTGYYGASNSFPQNAYVEIENLENGKRTRVIIVDRLSDSGLLMLVSNQAAQDLGIYQSDIARIKVRLLSSKSIAEASVYDDLPYNPDPDLNPAAALMGPEDLITQDSRGAVSETVEPVKASAPEPEEESDFPVLSDLPPEIEGLDEAEVLLTEEEVPADIAADSPEKPFDWPEGVIEPEPEPEPEPLHLTMEDFREGSPVPESDYPEGDFHTPEARKLWPDSGKTVAAEEPAPGEEPGVSADDLASAAPSASTDVTGGAEIELPGAALELVSSGFAETSPAYNAEEQSFKLSTLPAIEDKVSDQEYITDATDYYAPPLKEVEVSGAVLPVPEPGISEEVIAVLVGDHLMMSESAPEQEAVKDGYSDVPELAEADDGQTELKTVFFAEASPLSPDEADLLAEALPLLPDAEDSIPVEVANGYVSPEKADYTGVITDYPDYADASAPDEIPGTDEELAYSEAPAEDDSVLPDITEIPEIVSAEESDDAATADVEPAVPEYDENLEVTLVPAEVRPPELVEEETGLLEGEPEAVRQLAADAAEHSPAVETANGPEPVVVDAEVETAVEAAAVVAAEPSETVLTVPERIMMVSKLQQKKHYLQLGAYKEKNSAIKAAGSLEANYPVTIFTDEAAAEVSYKLLLGPLTADESGIMLYNFRAGGYSDAFIRRIE